MSNQTEPSISCAIDVPAEPTLPETIDAKAFENASDRGILMKYWWTIYKAAFERVPFLGPFIEQV